MLTQEYIFQTDADRSPFSDEARLPVFFDIETTGLSPKTSLVYLIGCCVPLADTGQPNGQWLLRQWFAETPDDEPQVLRAFLAALPENGRLCHYNGATFDLPFLAARMKLYGLTGLPRTDDTLDYYRLLAPLKTLFSLPGRRQKQLEPLVGMKREDRLDGGALIPFYAEYVGRSRFAPDRAQELLSLLLLHNREDVQGLVRISSLSAVCTLLQGGYETEALTRSEREVRLTLTLSRPLPCPVDCEWPVPDSESCVGLHAEGLQALLTVPLTCGTLYYYYENYRDYVYLPEEDLCIYKSLAESVDRTRRVRCTRETARCKKEGCFLPQPEPVFAPAFRAAPSAAVSYFEPELLEQQPNRLRIYIRCLLKQMA